MFELSLTRPTRFKKSIQNRSDMPIPIDDILKVSEITIDASIKCGLS